MNAKPPHNSRTLRTAQVRALDLLKMVEESKLIAPGRWEREIAADVVSLAQEQFGVTRRWHKDIVRSGPNTLATFHERRADRRLTEDEIVFLDLGPVFGDLEADVGRSFVVGSDPAKHRLVSDLEELHGAVGARMASSPNISGAELYRFAAAQAHNRGWDFIGKIAGHIVGPFSHLRDGGSKAEFYISPENERVLADVEFQGAPANWIIEIHIASPCASFAGFFEQLA
ncbi:aminopeptidase P family protein [Pacificimonas sp. WHA3]|uniref:Aminopeptidase P family protein n=1 Tax=Pacificimonas pallii TaxID=2827236 RepID=A0ABS6SCJ5_9SPHN|nr:M24 family metallopeptidase [Pacificimonas pallii]MBV7256138.1 aminopeptidase P family protein [Pacificimonas pallii]